MWRVCLGVAVIMQSHMERQKMERPDIIMEGIMEKPFMMAISVWTGWSNPDRTPHTGLLEYKNVYRPGENRIL